MAAKRAVRQRTETSFTDIEYAQMQTVRLALGIASDADFLRYSVQKIVEGHSEAVASARYFSSSFRDAIGRLESQNRLFASLLLLALLQPQQLPDVLGKPVDQLPFMRAADLLPLLQALVARVERSVEQT